MEGRGKGGRRREERRKIHLELLVEDARLLVYALDDG
jgi:hypothetical protein